MVTMTVVQKTRQRAEELMLMVSTERVQNFQIECCIYSKISMGHYDGVLSGRWNSIENLKSFLFQ